MHPDAIRAYNRIAASSADAPIKKTCTAALLCVGTLPWANEMAPDHTKWAVGSPNHGGNGGLNCWTAVLFWAFQGEAVSAEWVHKYFTKAQAAADEAQRRAPQSPGAGSVAMSGVHEKRLKFRHSAAVESRNFGTILPGRIVFFAVPGRNMSHVALSLGNGDVASCWQVRAHRRAFDYPLMIQGFTHVVSIAVLKEICGGDNCTVHAPDQPFWSYIKNP
jgi:hypothetical protein